MSVKQTSPGPKRESDKGQELFSTPHNFAKDAMFSFLEKQGLVKRTITSVHFSHGKTFCQEIFAVAGIIFQGHKVRFNLRINSSLELKTESHSDYMYINCSLISYCTR